MITTSKVLTYVLPSLCGALGTILIMFSTSRYGVGLSADSATYISTARNLMNGEGYTNFKGEPLLVFPPLYSTALATFSWGWFDLIAVARYLNAACFGLITAFSTHWLIVHTKARSLSLLGSAAILLAVPLIEVSVYAWSEPLFILASLLCLFLLEQFLKSDTHAHLVLSGVCAAFAYLTRYTGVTLVLTGMALLLLNHRRSMTCKVRDVTLFSVISLAPVVPWFVRNYLISSTLTGYRAPSQSGLGASMVETIRTGTAWVLPTSLPVIIRAGGMALLVVTIWTVAHMSHRRGDRSVLVDVHQVFPLMLFTAIYTVFLIMSVTLTALSPIDNRYLSPIYVPLVLSFIFVAHKITTTRTPVFGSRLARAGLLLGLMLWLSYPTVKVIRAVRQYQDEGAGGFHTARWVHSELMNYLRVSPLDGLVFCNEAYGLYLLTGQSARVTPAKYFYESRTLTRQLEDFNKLLEAKGFAYLVQFDTDSSDYQYLYSVAELDSLYEIEPVVTLADGAIYTVRN